MKTLYVTTISLTMNSFFKPHIEMLVREGHSVDLACNFKDLPPDALYSELGCGIYQIDFSRNPLSVDNVKAYSQLKRVVESGGYDIVHCHTPNAAVITRLVCRMFRKNNGLKVFYTAHGFHFYKGAPKLNWILFYPVEKFCSRFTDKLITINKEDHARALKQLHAKRIEYVPGVGINTAKFRELEMDRKEKRSALGYGDDDFLALTVAEMTANKNHITILKALALLKDREEFQHIHYLICGRGEMWASLEESAKALGIADHVNFLGYRTDAPELYKASDLFLFVTFREGLSVALMEAMSSGMSIVCAKIRGNTDLIDDGVSGVFSENSPEAVAEHILAMYRDPQRRQMLGQAAAEKALLFDDQNVLNQVREIYLSL